MNWENPEPGVYEARTTQTVDVVLEVFDPQHEDADGTVYWFALRGGRYVDTGYADSIEEAKRLVEEAVKQ